MSAPDTQARRRLLLFVHTAGAIRPGVPAVCEDHEVASRHVQLVPCDDCCAWPRRTRMQPEGFDRVLLVEHASTCPMLRAALRRQEGRP